MINVLRKPGVENLLNFRGGDISTITERLGEMDIPIKRATTDDEGSKAVFLFTGYNATTKGLQCGKNAFYSAIRNPVYCGKIPIPANGNAEATYIDGLHEPIVSVELFNHVQRD